MVFGRAATAAGGRTLAKVARRGHPDRLFAL